MEKSNFDILRNIIIKEIKESSLFEVVKLREATYILTDEVEEYINISGKVSKDREGEVTQLKESLAKEIVSQISQEYSDKMMQKIFGIKAGLVEGMKFEAFKVFNKEKEEVSIDHKEGEVLMIDIWATWCGYCLGPMAENMTISKNVAGKNIRIIGVSCDKDQEKWKALLETNQWNQIDQYNNEMMCKMVGISGIPCILVINPKGAIEYIGHPAAVQLEEGLLKLAEGKEGCFKHEDEEDEKPVARNEWWVTKSREQQLEVVKAIIADVAYSVKKEGIKLIVATETAYNKKFEPCYNCYPILQGQVSLEENEKVKELIKELEKKYELKEYQLDLEIE